MKMQCQVGVDKNDIGFFNKYHESYVKSSFFIALQKIFLSSKKFKYEYFIMSKFQKNY